MVSKQDQKEVTMTYMNVLSHYLEKLRRIQVRTVGSLDDIQTSTSQILGIFLFSTVSRLALGPTQPPTQWIQGVPSLGIKQPGHKADHSPPSQE
jgi:hypothetical protein